MSKVIHTAAMLGLCLSPAGGCVTSAPKNITGSLNTLGLTLGSRMLLMPPSLTFIFRQRLERVWGDVLLTFLACTHCVANPNMISPTRFTSAIIKSLNQRLIKNVRNSENMLMLALQPKKSIVCSRTISDPQCSNL